MARHVGRYEDEWAAVLGDPLLLQRFVSFVNAPGTPDPSITFVSERGQPRPVDLPLPVRQPGPAVAGGPALEAAR
jgi:nitrite reductase (NADH) large subunit